jgi:general secretion pathway protein C
MELSTNNIIAWSKRYANWLPIIQWSGWLVITLILAKLFWVLMLYSSVPDVSNQKAATNYQSSSQSGSNDSFNISQLTNRHLFGNANAAPALAVQDDVIVERETRLNLKLRGIYSAENVKRSNSIIEDDKGKQSVYFIDDKLVVSGNVYLRQVFPNKVILETNGVKEVLRLKDSLPPSLKTSKKSSAKGNKKKRVDDKRKNRAITKSLNKYKKQLLDDPLSLVGLVNYKPKMVDGEMKGIEISPGKDKRLFTQLGLRRRDVITAVNGVSLTNPQDAMGLLSEIEGMTELQVEIERGNESVSLLLDLNAGSDINQGPKSRLNPNTKEGI